MTTIVPIFVCVVLPVSIVLIIFLSIMNRTNKRAKVLIKAIESNNSINAEKLAEALSEPKKTAREILNRRLLQGCIYTLVGLALVIIRSINLYARKNFSSDFATLLILFGCISLAIGISFLIVYFVTRKQIENQEEEK